MPPFFNRNNSPATLREKAIAIFTTHPNCTLRCSGDFTRGLSALILALCEKALKGLPDLVTAQVWLGTFRRDLNNSHLHTQAPLYLAELAHCLSRSPHQLDNREDFIKQSIYHYITFMKQAASNPAFTPTIQENIETIIRSKVIFLINLLGTTCPPNLQRPENRAALQHVSDWCVHTTPSLQPAPPATAQAATAQPPVDPEAAQAANGEPPAATAVSMFKVEKPPLPGPLGQKSYRFDPYTAASFLYM